MDKRAPLRINRAGAVIAIALVVIYGLWHLSGAWAFVFGSIFLAFGVWVLSKLWNPLPRSFWWYCVLATCLGGIGLLLIKSTSA